MDMGLKGKLALVTGASRGIGKACARVLAKEGCDVVICARGKEALEKAAEEIKAEGLQVLAVQADVAKPEDIRSMVAKTVEKLGRIDVLVNNAGTGRLSAMLQLPEEEFRTTWT